MLFNSLGSNYDQGFVIRSLLSIPQKKDENILLNYLEERYSGKALLLYKGREAIKLALMILGLPKNTKVGVTGFTCYVVVQAITEAGYKPVFIDINKKNLNSDLTEIKKHKDIKVLIIQNTLGIPCNMSDISEYCKDNAIYLIEDLAHSIGAKYDNGYEAGTVGDFTCLSFSQDKSVDGISGGALVIRNKTYNIPGKAYLLNEVAVSQQMKDRVYPLLTALIRSTYGFGIGKFLHFIFKKLNLLSQPVGGEGVIEFHKLPYLNCRLVYEQYLKLDTVLRHRKTISSIYIKKLKLHSYGILRWPLLIRNKKSLIDKMKTEGLFISDIWYDAPVAPFKLMSKSSYIKGSCPNAEEVAGQIVNLPTHVNVTVNEAEHFSDKIRKWINSN